MHYKIPLSKPYLDQIDFNEIKRCFDSTWISSKSPWVEKFEHLFAKKISQTKFAVAVNSGTSALFLALKALGIGPGDEVILPTLTMVATINAVVWTGATPVLVDSQSKQDWNISTNEIEKKITKKTKAIIPVHLYGYLADMKKILSIAKKYRLFVIEDAAEAMGSCINGKNAGSFGDISCFSLYSNKIITTGNGGIVATNNKTVYQLIKQLEFFDFNKKKHFYHYQIGYNLVLSGLQAALGVSQISKFNKLLIKRRKIFNWYYQRLKNNPNLSFIEAKDQNPNYWFPAVIFNNPKTKNLTQKKLTKAEVETRNFFIPLHQQPVFQARFHGLSFPNAEYFSQSGLLLPSFFDLNKKEIDYVCNIINSSFV
jgi:perosamine synthetase